MLNFLTQLFETSDIVVPRQSVDGNERLAPYLIECELINRDEWNGNAPEFDVNVAMKAAHVLLLFCRAVVYRELDEGFVSDQLASIALPETSTATVFYSADLTLRFLPDIYDRLCRTTSEDPLLPVLLLCAKLWPLSTVGIPDTAPGELPDCMFHESLFGTYVDRVIQRRDAGRCTDARVGDAVKAAIGDHRFLAPQLADELAKHAP